MTDDFAGTLRVLLGIFEHLGIDTMLVGSVAALVHGHARATQDFDLVADLDVPRVEALVRALPDDRFYVSLDAARDACRRRTLFNVVDMVTGWKVDIIPLKRRPFSEQEFARREVVDLDGVAVRVATLEDTLVAKLEWARLGGGSARQLDDVRALLRLGGERVDRAYVERWVRDLGLDEAWRAVLERP